MHLPEAQEVLEDHCHPSGQQGPIRKNKQQDKWRPKHLSRHHWKIEMPKEKVLTVEPLVPFGPWGP